MRRFDVVSTISRRMHELLLRKGVPALRAKLAVNWVNLASFALPTPAPIWPRWCQPVAVGLSAFEPAAQKCNLHL